MSWRMILIRFDILGILCERIGRGWRRWRGRWRGVGAVRGIGIGIMGRAQGAREDIIVIDIEGLEVAPTAWTFRHNWIE